MAWPLCWLQNKETCQHSPRAPGAAHSVRASASCRALRSRPVSLVPRPVTPLTYTSSLAAHREEWQPGATTLFTVRPHPGEGWRQGGETACRPPLPQEEMRWWREHLHGNWTSGENEQGEWLFNWRSEICLWRMSSDFPKHLKLISRARPFVSLSVGHNLTPARAELGKPADGPRGSHGAPVCLARPPAPRHTSAERREPPSPVFPHLPDGQLSDGSAAPVQMGTEGKAQPHGSGYPSCQSPCRDAHL